MVAAALLCMAHASYAQVAPTPGAPPTPTNPAEKAAVSVSCPAPGSGIYVDNQMVGTCPMAEDILVDPGQHTFQAKRGQQRTQWVGRALVAGERQVIDLGPLKGGKFSASYSAAIALGVIGLAGIITGAAFGGVSIRAMDEHEEKAELLLGAGGGCAPPGPASVGACQELADIREKNTNYVIAGGIVGGVSGALFVAAIAWGVTLENRNKTYAGAQTIITPIVTPHHQGVALTTGF